MTGKDVVEELLDRGHQVTGIGRNPPKIEPREGLALVGADLFDPEAFTSAIRGQDVVVSAFSPGHTMDLSVYKGMVEAGWRLKRAIQAAGSPYLINVGGVGSLMTERGVQVLDDPLWPEWYVNTATPAYLRHLYDMTHIDAFLVVADEREATLNGGGDPYAPLTSDVAKGFINALRAGHELAAGARAQFEIFREDRTFRWTFLSPPWQYMYGPRTGRYRIVEEYLPLEDGVPAGISVADIAIAIADEAENQRLAYEHWSAATALGA
jgi:putative NADH-flavin reductase